jgi:hypothetical protein
MHQQQQQQQWQQKIRQQQKLNFERERDDGARALLSANELLILCTQKLHSFSLTPA